MPSTSSSLVYGGPRSSSCAIEAGNGVTVGSEETNRSVRDNVEIGRREWSGRWERIWDINSSGSDSSVGPARDDGVAGKDVDDSDTGNDDPIGETIVCPWSFAGGKG